MTEEQKNLMKSLYVVRDLSPTGLSPKQTLELEELENTYFQEEVTPALFAHVAPLLAELKGAFTLRIMQVGDKQRFLFQRDDTPRLVPPPGFVSEPERPEGNVGPEGPDDLNELSDDDVPDELKKKEKSKRPRFRFSMVGICIDEWVRFDPTGLMVRVVADEKVEYNGQSYRLSPFVRKFLPEVMRNASGAYQGAKYFSYNGQVLDSMRPDSKKREK